jgi:hypothetical protein
VRTRRSEVIMSVAIAMSLLGSGRAAHAEGFGAPPSSFRVDAAPRGFARAPALEGYVYNDGLYRITNVRLKVEALDSAGAVVEGVLGSVLGDIEAGSRGYFLVPLKTAASSYRVTVVSFDRVSRGGAP